METIVKNIKVQVDGSTVRTTSLMDNEILSINILPTELEAIQEYHFQIDMLNTMIEIHDEK